MSVEKLTEVERYRRALHQATGGRLTYDDQEMALIAARVAVEHEFPKEVVIASFESRGPDIEAAWPSADELG